MPEFIHNFTQGKMNHDLDERMVPNGQYRDALNVTVATSESSNVGALQNLKGNTERKGKPFSNNDWSSSYISDLVNPVCIGSIRNEPTECIYWFIVSEASRTSPSISAIAEFNQSTGKVSPVIVDTKGILNFSKDQKHLITGINIVDDLLYFTDNLNEPKKVNITKWKLGSTNFTTHTVVPNYNKSTAIYSNPTSSVDFAEEDITVIKKSPLYTLTADFSTSTRSAAGVEVPGTGVTPLSCTFNPTSNFPTSGDKYTNFTYITRPATDFLAVEIAPLPTFGEWLEDQESADPKLNSDMGVLTIQTNGITTPYGPGDNITLTGSAVDDDNNTDEYTIRMEVVSTNGGQIDVKILSIPNEILRFGDDGEDLVLWEVLLEEKNPMFEFVFPRFAYRWKYENGEYSCFSPFTEAVFEGDDFEYVASDGYNIGMQNHIRSLILKDWDWGSEEVIELDILYKHSTSNNIYIVDTIKDRTVNSFELKTELIGKTVQSNQLLRVFDNVPRKARAQEITANRLIFANYLQNFNVPNCEVILGINSTEHPGSTQTTGVTSTAQVNNGGSVTSNVHNVDNISGAINPGVVVTGAGISGTVTVVVFNGTQVTLSSNQTLANNTVLTFTASEETSDNDFRRPKASIKSIRKYQLGIVFQDKYGRQTPVFTNPNATYNLGKETSDKINTISATLQPLGNIPSWLTHAKFYIKDTSNEYYNLALDRYYFAEDGNVWLSFPSSERNKVDIETYLILKKQHDSDNPSIGPCRYKILDIQSQAPEFIASNNKSIAIATCQVLSGFQQGFSELSFDGPGVDGNVNFRTGFNGDTSVQISMGGFVSEIVGVASGGPINDGTQYIVNLDKALGNASSWMGETVGLEDGTNVQINILKKVEERLPEFEGRFFVKINRDTDFETNIVKQFEKLNTRYGVVGQILATGRQNNGVYAQNQESSGSSFGFYWTDNTNTSVCDCVTEYKMQGIGSGGNGTKQGSGSKLAAFPDTTPATMREKYDLPMFQGNTVSMCFTGVKNIDEPAFASKPGYSGKPMTEAVEGKYIKIIGRGTNEGKSTRAYRIKEHYKNGSYRGARDGGCLVNCNSGNQRGIEGNQRTAIALVLDDIIEEEWVGNGSVAAMENLYGFQLVEEITSDDNSILTSSNPAIFETEPKEAIDLDIYYEASKAYPISELQGQTKILPYFNVYSFGNAVESDRIRDDFNTPKVGKGVKVSTIFPGPYAEERRSSGLIFSQIYNSQAGINRLNQFIQAEPITKDLNPEYGSIQKLHSKNTNLTTLCEDKCLRILANKDALFNADGNTNITSNKAVLGQATPYAGEFGISTNPESFADYGFRSYFADKNRGAVIRLSQDGITNIALKGMSDFFADNLPSSTKIIGSYNDDKENYNLTLDFLTDEWQDKLSKTPKDKTNCEVPNDESDDIETTTVSFKETVDGWTSRKSYYTKTGSVFYPLESGESLNDKYYTFNKGLIWEHASNPVYNNFYGTQYDSSVNVIINDVTESIKGFKTLNYAGTDSRRYKYGTSTGLSGLSIEQVVHQQIAPSIINSETITPGWYTNYINTDMEEGQIKEFVKKENKYFNKIKGLKTFYKDNCDNNVDSSAFQTQGLGFATVTGGTPTTFPLTVNLDTSCSTEGVVNPDTTKKFWYQWRAVKQDPTLETVNTTSIATDQLVKCDIESFYNQFVNGFNQIIKEFYNYKFFASQGINVNTQLYNEDNSQLTASGKFLYIEPATTPDNNALNANIGGTSVPNTYFIITVTNGTISAKTQYNTLASCGTAAPAANIFAHLGWFKNIAGQGNYFINFNVIGNAQSNPALRAASLKTSIISWLNSNSVTNISNLGNYSYDYGFSASGGVAVGQTLFKSDGSALDSNSNSGSFVYRTDQEYNGYFTENYAVSRDDAVSDSTWSALPDTYKIVVFENSIITHITNMNAV